MRKLPNDRSYQPYRKSAANRATEQAQTAIRIPSFGRTDRIQKTQKYHIPNPNT